MTEKYLIVFDDVLYKKLKKILKDKYIKNIFQKMLNKLELKGPLIGELLDSKLHLYELKNKRPPLRLYYRFDIYSGEILIFDFEMKTNSKKQKLTIARIKNKLFKFLNLFSYTFFL